MSDGECSPGAASNVSIYTGVCQGENMTSRKGTWWTDLHVDHPRLLLAEDAASSEATAREGKRRGMR